MLHLLRRAVKSIVAKVLLAVLILSFAVWGIGDIFIGGGGGTVARVGSTEVSAELFARAVERQRTQMMRQRGEVITLEAIRAAGLDRRELTALIMDATYDEELARLKIAVPADAVRDTIRSNRNFQDGQGAFSQYQYQTTLAEVGYSPGEFERLTRALLGQQILQDAVAPPVDAPPGAAELIAAWQGESRAVSAVTLPASLAPDPGAPDDAALDAFFQANAQTFTEPERRWGRYFHIDIATLTAEAVPPPDEVRAEYDARPELYSIPATRTVEQIVFADRAAAEAAIQRLLAGASFLELAAEQNLRPDDLDLGTVTRDDLPPATAEAVFALTEPGIAGPLEGPFGHALLNVTEVELGGAVPFEEVRDRIAAALAVRRAQQAALDLANRIDDLRASGKTLDEIAAETGLALQPIAGLDPRGVPAEGPPPAAAADPRFLGEVADAIDGEERDVVALSDGGYVLVMIDRIVARHLPELDQVRERVVEAWALEERLSALEARLADRIAQGTVDLAALAAEAGTRPEELSGITRTGAPRAFSEGLVEAIFAAAPGAAAAGRGTDGRTVIVARVKGVTPLAGEALAEATARVEEALERSLARDQLDFYGRSLRARHGAVVSEETIERVFERLGQTGG